jgi:KDO2-lipid IV(A) lauroyltransferase
MPLDAPVMRAWLRAVRYGAEAGALAIALATFRMMPLDTASAVGGWIGRTYGPRLRVTDRARRNLRNAFPDLCESDIERIIIGMWDNLGRTSGEYPHIARFDFYSGDGRVEVVGLDVVERLRDDGIGCLFFSAHIANWEILALVVTQRGIRLLRVYRRANNPISERLLQWVRGKSIDAVDFPKGAASAEPILRALRNGEHLAMLLDQKMNDGIPIPFFGRPAMTAPAIARFAQRFDYPIVPARIERLAGARFRVTIGPEFKVSPAASRNESIELTMRRINGIIEGWVRDRPEQWLWLHRRWPD